MNRRLAVLTLDFATAAGVREWCVCAGARNSPFVVELAARKAPAIHFFEERSAAFFALGRARASRRPVAVVTTSGTAVAELLPALVEAYYSGVPLVAVTADRPRRYRGTGAPQSVEQVGIFSVYARTIDVASPEELLGESVPSDRPWHVNVCFDEPLPGEVDSDPLEGRCFPRLSPRRCAEPQAQPLVQDFLTTVKRPLVLVGPLPESERESAVALLTRLGAPAILEAPSGLRAERRLSHLEIASGDRWLRADAAQSFDGVLRLGGVPCSRVWRDLDRLAKPVLSISQTPFSGSPVGRHLVGSLSDLHVESLATGWTEASLRSFLAPDRERLTQLDRLLAEEPQSEPGMVHALSHLVPPEATLFLGNSLPIREWDLAAERISRRAPQVSRGANGIDGQISTFYGLCRPGETNWALLGDLTTLYDLSAPWVLRHLPGMSSTLAVMNNGGGAIFSRMFGDPVFQNRHAVGFEAWASMWGMSYERWTSVPSRWEGAGHTVVEITPDDAATSRFWKRWEAVR